MNTLQFIQDSRPFLDWLVKWYESRPTLDLAGLIEEVGGPDNVAVFAVDVLTGFCREGPLSSARVGRIVGPIVSLFERAYALGVRHFVLPQDAHPADSVEFGAYPPHCVRGTPEAETVAELKTLPFSDLFTVIEKNSISSAIGTALEEWLEAHPQVTAFLVVGDCTDLCTHQLAMYLRLRANARNLPGVRVIVPADGVDTFDIPVEVAEGLGIVPHPADLLHLIFLYNMAENGMEVVARAV